MNADDLRMMQSLVTLAGDHFDGHLTIMKFTTNWRVGFVTPADRDAISEMPAGATFIEAAANAIAASGKV